MFTNSPYDFHSALSMLDLHTSTKTINRKAALDKLKESIQKREEITPAVIQANPQPKKETSRPSVY